MREREERAEEREKSAFERERRAGGSERERRARADLRESAPSGGDGVDLMEGEEDLNAGMASKRVAMTETGKRIERRGGAHNPKGGPCLDQRLNITQGESAAISRQYAAIQLAKV